MTETLKTIFTEEEAIRITIQHGYDGAELETNVWKQRGCLQINGTYSGLISKLETIYNNVAVEGKGKKRKYILTDKKKQVTERQLKYKGTIPSEQDIIMQEYIFNKLIDCDNGIYTYKGWATTLEFIDPNSFNIEDMITGIKYIHFGFETIYNPKEVVSNFLQTIRIRNRDIIEKSFQRLQKESRIQVTETFTIQDLEGKYEYISEAEYDEIIEHLRMFLAEKEITYYNYSMSLTSIHKSEKMKQIIKEAQTYIEDEFDIQKFYRQFRIKILDNSIKREINKDEFVSAYFERLIHLSAIRQNKYNESLSFWKRFYMYNTLTLLKFIGATGIDELINIEYKSYGNNKDNFHLDNLIHMSEIRPTFGKLSNMK